jgi:hypothetical protein
MGALDQATVHSDAEFGKNVLMTGSQLALRKRDASHITPKAKCPLSMFKVTVGAGWAK